VRSLGTLLGEVLREQAGEELFAHVEALRQGTIRRRDAEARGSMRRLRGTRRRRWSWCIRCRWSGRFC
jgi:phosphoenolpyruvate carboxylase